MRSPREWLRARAEKAIDESIAWMEKQIRAGDVPAAAIGLGNTVRIARFLAIVLPDDGRPALALRLAGSLNRRLGNMAEAHRLYTEVIEFAQAGDNPDAWDNLLVAMGTLTEDQCEEAEPHLAVERFSALWHWCERARERFGETQLSAVVAARAALQLVAAHLDTDNPAGAIDTLRSFARWQEPDADHETARELLTAAMPALSVSNELLATTLLTALFHHRAVDADFRVTAGEYLGGYHEWRGQPAEAYESFAAAHDALTAEADPLRRADLLFQIARLADTLGRYGEAHRAYGECLSLQRNTLPPDDDHLLLTRHNLAELVRHRGDAERAGAEFAELAAIHRDRPVTEQFGWVLVHLAQTQLDRGHPDAAARSCAEGLALPLDNAKLRYRLHEVAHVAAIDQGADPSPPTELVEAVQELATQHGEDSLDHLSALGNLVAFNAASDPAGAEEAGVELLTWIGGRDAGEWGRLAGMASTMLATIRLDRGDTEGALSAIADAVPRWQQEYTSLWRIGSVLGAGVAEPWELREPLVRLALRPGEHRLAATALAFQVVTGAKGLQADALAKQRDAVLEGRPELLRLHYLAADLRRASLSSAEPPELRDVEDMLAHEIPPTALQHSFDNADPEVVAEALPPDSALVEYARIGQWYVAFVLPAGEPDRLTVVDLGPAGPVDDAVIALRQRIQALGRGLSERPDDEQPHHGWRDDAAAVADLIWAPIAERLGTDQQVVLAPDGPLHALPFDVLPDTGGAPMIVTRLTSQLATGRDLCRVETRPNWQTLPPLVIAAPEFGPPGTPFPELPGAAREGRQVAELIEAEMHQGPGATRALLLDVTDPEILHIATHGFGIDPFARPDADRPAWLPATDNPLVASGLAVAGANRPSDGDIGLVTALDILGLPLFGTDLVVLSSCESGLGPVVAGAGLAGLARSFLLAGARAAVWSLWRVDDEWTRRLMHDFYTRLLAGTPRAAALRAAKQQIQAAEPDRPELWASFVAQGDPGSLLRFRETRIPEAQVCYGDIVQARDLYPDHEFAALPPNVHIVDKGGRKVGVFQHGDITVASVNAKGMSMEQLADLMRFGSNRLDEASAAADRARDAFNRLDFAAAATDYHRALAALDRARNHSQDEESQRQLDMLRGDMHARLAMCADQLDRFEDAAKHGEEAVNLYGRAGVRDLDYAVALENLGVSYGNLGDEEAAAALVREALKVKLKVCPNDERQLAFTREALAVFTGRPEPKPRRRWRR